jgi:hypothetical protein
LVLGSWLLVLNQTFPHYLQQTPTKPQPHQSRATTLKSIHQKKVTAMFKNIKWGEMLVTLLVVVVGVVIAQMLTKQTVEGDGSIKTTLLGLGAKKDEAAPTE